MARKNFYTKILIGFLMNLFVMCGDITANTLNNSLIFNRLGVEAFGYITFFKALSVIITSAVIAALAGRVGKMKLLLGFLSIIAASGMASSLLLNTHLVLSLALLVAAEGALLVGFNFIIWPIYNDVFPVLVRKKAFPLVAAGYGAAGIAAGFLVAASLKQAGTVGLAVAFTFNVAAAAVMGLFLIYFAKASEKSTETNAPESEAPVFLKELRSMSKLFTGAPFLRWLFAFNIFVWISYRLIDFRFNLELHNLGGTEERFSELLGYCYSGINTTIVLYQIFCARSVLTHAGLTRLLALYPALMVCLSVATLATSSPLFTFANRAVAELMLYTVVLGAIALVYNIVESGIRAAAQALIEGLSASLGTMIGSGLLVSVSFLVVGQTQNTMSETLLLAANLGSLFCALKLGKMFIEKALQNLSSGDRLLTLNSVQALQERGHTEAIGKLTEVAFNADGKYDETTIILAVRTLAQLHHHLMPNLFLRMLADESPRKMLFAFNMLQDFYLGEVRSNFILKHKILQAIESVIIRTATGDDSMNIVHKTATRFYFKIAYPQSLSNFLEKVLESKQSRLIANTIEALAYLENKYAYLFIERFLDDSNNRVRSTAIVELWNLREDRNPLILSLKKMLADPEPRNRISAIWALGKIRSEQLLPLLIPYLDANAPQVLRLHAVYAILRFPYRTLSHQMALPGHTIQELYCALLREVTNTEDPQQAQRALHLAIDIDRSHVSKLDSTVLALELDTKKMGLLYRNLLEQGASAEPWLKFVIRFVEATAEELPNTQEPDLELAA